jgi:uncharacterized repeat protein (TIGR01451 family)
MRHPSFNRVARTAVIVGVLLPALSAHAATPTDMAVKVTGASFKVGREGRYAVTVANRGKQSTDAEVHVRVTLPAGLGFASHTGSAWTCLVEGQAVDCVTHDSFRVGRTQTLRLKVGVCDAAFPSVVTPFEVAYLADTNTSNNVATRFTTVRPGQCLSVIATPSATPGGATITSAPSGTATPTPTITNTAAATATPTTTVTPGGPTATPTPTPFGQYVLSLSGAPRNLTIGGVTTATYQIDLHNVRPIAMTNVTITNSLPAGLKFVESVPPPDTQQGNTLTYILPSMAALSSTSITIQAELLPMTPAGTSLTDTVQVTDDLGNFAQASFAGSVRAGPR